MLKPVGEGSGIGVEWMDHARIRARSRLRHGNLAANVVHAKSKSAEEIVLIRRNEAAYEIGDICRDADDEPRLGSACGHSGADFLSQPRCSFDSHPYVCAIAFKKAE